MTIMLHTGLPGASKTLYTITYVKAWAEKENRPVYYSGIKDLMLPWTEIDPTKWFDCPSGAIIVIDECQTVFRPRSFGSNVPDYVAKLETHRHQGHDIVLITQHPMLCDPSIRRLAGVHKHIVRKFGMQASTIHEWNSVRENCDKPSGRTDSIKHHWRFDKKTYGLYKSAEVHTVKRNIPARVLFLFFVLPALILFLGYRFYSSISSRVGGENAAPVNQAYVQAKNAASGQIGGSAPAYLDPVADARQYAYDRTPRIDGLTHTAPRYDEMAKPSKVPMPVACVQQKTRCTCYTQQATRMDLSEALCRGIVDRGYFMEFDDGSGEVQKERSAVNSRVLDRTNEPLPLTGSTGRPVAATVSLPGEGYGVNGRRGEGVRIAGMQ